MLCRLAVKVVNAPPAVWASETASLALFTAWLVPLICVVKSVAIARPAASSAALLIFKPEDKRCSAWDNVDLDAVRLRCAFSESMFVFNVKGIVKAPKNCWISPARLRPYVVFTFTLIRRTGDHTQNVYRIDPAVLERNLGLIGASCGIQSQLRHLALVLQTFPLTFRKGDIGRATQNWSIRIGIGTQTVGRMAAAL